MNQKQAEPDCTYCHMGWLNQDANGKITSCYEQCRFSAIVDHHLVEYADVWRELANA